MGLTRKKRVSFLAGKEVPIKVILVDKHGNKISPKPKKQIPVPVKVQLVDEHGNKISSKAKKQVPPIVELKVYSSKGKNESQHAANSK